MLIETKLRPSGIDQLGEMSWGTHFCLFYETGEDLLDILIPYFKAGLENHEFCLCVTSGPVIAEEAERALREAVPDFEQYLTTGQIEIIPHMNWYLKNGRFDPLKVRQGWLDKLDQAIARGYAGMRFIANISWLEKQDWDRFAEYEGTLDEVFLQSQMIGICAYSLEHCSAAGMLDVVRHHQFTLARREGVWENLEGDQLKRAHEEVLKLNNELAQRVRKRTAELTDINEQLRAEIVERRQAEERLRWEKRLTEQIINSLPGVFYVLDEQGRFHRWNKNFERVTGYSGEEVAQLRPLDLFTGEDQKKIEECVQDVFHKGKSAAEVDFVAKDGTRTPYYFTGRRVQLDDKLFDFGMGVDITERKQAEAATKESEERLRLAFEAAGIGTGEMNLQTHQILFSNALQQILGFAPGTFSSPTFQEYVERIHPEERAIVQQVVENTTADQPYIAIDYRIIWPDGSIHWVTSRARAFYDGAGKAIRMVGALMDITERKQAEELIRQQSARSQLLADISRTFAEVGLGYQSVLNTIVKRTAELIGDLCVIVSYSSDGKQNTLDAAHHRDPGALALVQRAFKQYWHSNRQRIRRLLSNESIYMPVVNPEELRPTLDPLFWPYFDEVGVSSLIYVPLHVQGQVIGALGVFRDRPGRPYTPEDQASLQDIADRAALTLQNARLFEQVQASQERLRVLSQRLVDVQESEQRRLAREIHDDISQTLTALMMQLGTAKHLLPKSARTVRAILEQTEELTEETMERTRSIIAGLRPQVLDDLGLVPALRRLGDELHDSTGVTVRVNISRLPKRLPSPTEVTLFRIVQEALANIRKHAQARHVTITLAKEAARVVLSVQDDGVGFEMLTNRSRHASGEMVINGGLVIPTGHFGLIGIQEQVAPLGGAFQVRSARGEGTTIRVELPL